jgi:predicted kinase
MTVKLLVIAGPPCAGKSSLAAAIAVKLGFHWLQVDRILSTLIPNSDRGKRDRDVAYRAALLIAEELLDCSRSVLLDATYGSHEQRKAVEACAVAQRVPLYLVQCRVSPEMAVARFKRRGRHPAIDLSERRVRALAAGYRYSEVGLTLGAEMPLAASTRRVEEYLLQVEPGCACGSWSAAALEDSS